jgi:hypothetical protein
VFALSPVIRSETDLSSVPEPPSRRGVVLPYEVVVPYWNQYSVGLPPALPWACSVAARSVTSVAGSVVPLAQPAASSAANAIRIAPKRRGGCGLGRSGAVVEG